MVGLYARDLHNSTDSDVVGHRSVALLGRADTHCEAHTTGVRWSGTNISLYTRLIAQSSILFYLKLFSLDLRKPYQHGFELTTWKMFIPRMRPKDSYFQNYVHFNIIYVVNLHFIPASLFVTAPLYVPTRYKPSAVNTRTSCRACCATYPSELYESLSLIE